MTILITGGNGFIGRNLAAYFQKNYRVIAPGRAELDLLDDEAVDNFFKRHDIDFVIHSATTPGHRNAPPVSDLVARNLRIFCNLQRQAARFKKMIYLGSGAVYDMRYYRPKMPESYFGVHMPADPHGFSKYLIAKHVEQSDNIVELRLFGVFGRYEDYAIRFISNAICKAIFNLPITLRQNRRFDYLFVDDLGPIVEHFITSNAQHRFYNVTPDESVELSSLAEMVRDVAGRAVEILIAQQGMGDDYTGDNTRLRKEFREASFTPVRDAVASLYQWYYDRRDILDKQLLTTDK